MVAFRPWTVACQRERQSRGFFVGTLLLSIRRMLFLDGIERTNAINHAPKRDDPGVVGGGHCVRSAMVDSDRRIDRIRL